MENRFTVAAETGSAIRHQALALSGTHRLAQVGLAGFAELALATFRGVQRNHMVADFQAGHALANRLNDTAAFMAQNRRENTFRIFTRQRKGIGMTHARGDNLDPHFTGLRWCNLNLFNL